MRQRLQQLNLQLPQPLLVISGKVQKDVRNMKQVQIYTDGACTGNPGKGGYGAVLIYGENEKRISAGYRLTTNNRKELLAAVSALELLKTECRVTLYSDSKYLTDAINKGWIDSWKKNGWVKSDKKKVLNTDLWKRLDALFQKHSVSLVWVKGHNGNEYNEICDEMAVAAYNGDDLLTDDIYETGEK